MELQNILEVSRCRTTTGLSPAFAEEELIAALALCWTSGSDSSKSASSETASEGAALLHTALLIGPVTVP